MADEKTIDTTILNVRLPQEIIDWLDSLVNKGMYGNRSEAVRDFLREYAVKTRKERIAGKSAERIIEQSILK